MHPSEETLLGLGIDFDTGSCLIENKYDICVFYTDLFQQHGCYTSSWVVTHQSRNPQIY